MIACGMLAGGAWTWPDRASGQGLGRLFITPEERFQLDELRREYEYGEPVEEEVAADVQPEQDPIELQLTINGLVVRSSGNNSTWINGNRVSRGEATREGIQVRDEAGGRVRITLPSGIDTIQLKPGQKIDVATGVVLDAYQIGPSGQEDAESAFDLGASEATVEGSSDEPQSEAPEALPLETKPEG